MVLRECGMRNAECGMRYAASGKRNEVCGGYGTVGYCIQQVADDTWYDARLTAVCASWGIGVAGSGFRYFYFRPKR
jgi:hypothetical protein